MKWMFNTFIKLFCMALYTDKKFAFKFLMQAEDCHMILELYVWLAQRFGDIQFPDIKLAREVQLFASFHTQLACELARISRPPNELCTKSCTTSPNCFEIFGITLNQDVSFIFKSPFNVLFCNVSAGGKFDRSNSERYIVTSSPKYFHQNFKSVKEILLSYSIQLISFGRTVVCLNQFTFVHERG